MKKILSTLFSTLQGGIRRGLLFLALLATTTLWAYDFQSDNLYYNITSDTTVEVTYQDQWPFDNYDGLTTATIPETVTYNGTTYSVTIIGDDAFLLCYSLSSITIPNSVTSIGDNAFNGSSLTSITIPNSVTSIGNWAFEDCSSLESVTIGNSVTSIGERAFEACSSLTSITIPNSVTSIGSGAFQYCSSLSSITIPNSVTSIGSSAFNGCSSLTAPVYNAHCFAYMPTSFEGAYTIPDGIKQIAGGAFSGCSSLSSITIPESVTSIGGAAFSNCSSLSSISIPNSVTSIGSGAFYNTLWYNNQPDGVVYAGKVLYKYKGTMPANTSITIEDGTVSISPYAFDGCSSLTSITIPNSVTSIGGSAFSNCSSLASITCEATTPPDVCDKWDTHSFDGVSNSLPVYVPCGTVSAYNAAIGWNQFSNIQEPLAEYSIQVSTSNSSMGSARVDKNTICGNSISATANYGYLFVRWSDSNTDNPRYLELTQDTILTAEFAPNNYTISTLCNDTERGTTSGDVTTTYLDYVTISATANYGYHFSHWDDYNYDNPRQVQVTEDKTYTAYFDKNTYYVTKNYDSNQGYVNGSTSGEYLDNITLIAEPNYGYHFVRWSDGNTENPRHFVLTQDTTFAAEFAQTFSGLCGDNLYWSYQNNSLTISGFGDMYNERPWGLFTNEIQTVVLPNGITHIGNDAFSDCTGLSEITIPYTVTSIGDYAFAGCRKLVQVNCYAINPPMAESTSFANYNVYLNVPCDNLQDYQLDMVFGSFKYIQCMEADSENVPTDDVVVTPGTNDVTITWPTAENADTYTIVIQKGNEVFCTLTFNADGQLLNIAFAPGRNGNNRTTQYATQTINGLRFTITGLNEGTHYTYDITAKDTEDNTLQSHSGEFTTQSNIPSSIDNTPSPITNTQKILRNGQLLIIRDGKTYTIMGAEIK